MNTIFAQIASYRDTELLPTIYDAIEQAEFPEHISFGICWQYQTEKELQYIEPLKNLNNCRVKTVPASESRGVGWARSNVQKLWRGEKYTLQIDSHMRFAPEWDTQLIKMLAMCPSKKPLLTAYPPNYEPPRKLLNDTPTRLVVSKIEESGVLTFQAIDDLSQFSSPQKGTFIAAGFIFADASLIREIPYDPNIYFYGEEFLFSAKAWTRGWDIYHPHQVVCWHYYNSGKIRPVHWNDHPKWASFNQLSEQRFREIIGIESSRTNFGIYGLGKTRTLKEYGTLCEINFSDWKNNHEINLIMYCSKSRIIPEVIEKADQLLQKNINWNYFIETAKQHRILPLLYHQLKNNHQETIPEPILKELKAYFYNNAQRNLFLTQELLHLLDIFKQNNIFAIPFKGLTLAVTAYGDLSLRIMGDLDILVNKQDMLKVQELLTTDGYVIQRKNNHLTQANHQRYLNSQYVYDEWYWKTLEHKSLFGVRVEMHWITNPKHIIFPLNSEDLLQNIEPVSLAGVNVPSLAPETLLVVLCINYTKHHWIHLKMICDIAELIQSHKTLNWEKIINQATRLRRKRTLFLSLYLAHNLLEAPIPAEIWTIIQADSEVESLAKQVSERLFVNLGDDPNLVEKILFNIRLRENLQDKIRYIIFSTAKVILRYFDGIKKELKVFL